MLNQIIYIKIKIGSLQKYQFLNFNFLGCGIDATSPSTQRDLSGLEITYYTNASYESCSILCSGYSYMALQDG